MTNNDIKQIWLEELELDSVDDDQNFFDVGGRALIMANVQARIKEELDTEVSIETLFLNPTIDGISKAIAQHDSGSASDAR